MDENTRNIKSELNDTGLLHNLHKKINRLLSDRNLITDSNERLQEKIVKSSNHYSKQTGIILSLEKKLSELKKKEKKALGEEQSKLNKIIKQKRIKLKNAQLLKSVTKERLKSLEDEQKKYKNIDLFRRTFIKNETLLNVLNFKRLSTLGKISTVMSVFSAVINKVFDTYNKIDTVVSETRQTLGMLPEEGRHLFHTIKDTTIQMAHLGVTFKDVGKAIVALRNEFTGIVAENETLLETSVMLNKSFGISNETSAKFLKTLAGISGTTASSQQSMVGFAKNISTASGVPLDQLMSDVANASDNVRMFVGDSADKMVKVATQARMLGTNLSDAANTAKNFLNFESSINAELKASALIGRQINFNYARRLFFNKNIIDGNKEILRLTKEVGFNQLNPIQQEAYAAAAGKSVSELQSMLQQEKNIQDIQSHGDKDALERLDRYKEMLKFSEDRAKDEGEIARLESLKLSNQKGMNVLQDQFNQKMLELQKPLLSITGPLIDIATYIFPVILDSIGLIVIGISKLLTKSVKWTKAIGNFIGPLTKMKGIIFGIGKILLPLTTFFAKWLNPIGWAIMGLQTISYYMEGLNKFGDGFINGLIGIPVAIFKAFLPFQTIHDLLDKLYIGHSPSKLGLGIMKGLEFLPKYITWIFSPLFDIYNWIQSSFVGGLIPGGTIKIPSLGIGGEDVSDSGSDSNKTSTSLNDIKVSNEVIASKIDELITLMANGGISVNLDGTRVNESLDTSRFNRGNRGIASSIS